MIRLSLALTAGSFLLAFTIVALGVVGGYAAGCQGQIMVASYYGSESGNRTANGERFDGTSLTAAHRTLPFGTVLIVRNVRNGQSVQVRINDRGPFIKGRDLDLSRAAAARIGLIPAGVGKVCVARVR